MIGAGIAQLYLQNGYNIIAREINRDLLDKSIAKIDKGLNKPWGGYA
ncbi:MAG TPA: hypothetical protein DDW17_02755 [Deltaproteobacteria bacterium]|nr:hypothetical protein [Deltaproteobacteria bacterium]